MTRGKAKGQFGTEKVAPKNTNCARLGSRLKEKDEVGKENRCQPLFVSAFCCAENRLRACWCLHAQGVFWTKCLVLVRALGDVCDVSESESSCSPQPFDSNNGVARCKSAHISCIALSHEAANSLSTRLRARRLLALHSKGPGVAVCSLWSKVSGSMSCNQSSTGTCIVLHLQVPTERTAAPLRARCWEM